MESDIQAGERRMKEAEGGKISDKLGRRISQADLVQTLSLWAHQTAYQQQTLD